MGGAVRTKTGKITYIVSKTDAGECFAGVRLHTVLNRCGSGQIFSVRRLRARGTDDEIPVDSRGNKHAFPESRRALEKNVFCRGMIILIKQLLV